MPPGAKVATSTWEMKKNDSGKYREILNTRGYEKVEGLHYDAANIASPVTNDMIIRIIMVLTMVVGWIAKILDMGGFFSW